MSDQSNLLTGDKFSHSCHKQCPSARPSTTYSNMLATTPSAFTVAGSLPPSGNPSNIQAVGSTRPTPQGLVSMPSMPPGLPNIPPSLNGIPPGLAKIPPGIAGRPTARMHPATIESPSL